MQGVRVIQREPTIYRAQRDGPSPAEQAQDALQQELSAQIARTTAEMQAIASRGPLDASERARMGELRSELGTLAGQLRELESERRETVIEEAAQAMAARAVGARAGVQVEPSRQEIPREAVDISIAFFITIGSMVVLFPLMRALGRILERRAAPSPRPDPEMTAQLARMEQALDAVSIEVERIAEGQRYTAKLLTERDKAGSLSP